MTRQSVEYDNFVVLPYAYDRTRISTVSDAQAHGVVLRSRRHGQPRRSALSLAITTHDYWVCGIGALIALGLALTVAAHDYWVCAVLGVGS